MTVAAANGVVIATEKKLPSILVDEGSVSDFKNCFDWNLLIQVRFTLFEALATSKHI